jgi:hypothetical protein
MRRWSEHLQLLWTGKHSSAKFQQIFDVERDMTQWVFQIVATEEVETIGAARRLEADWILNIPSELRLNMPNQTTITRERYARVVDLLKRGARYVDIRDEVGISMGMISRIKQGVASTCIN